MNKHLERQLLYESVVEKINQYSKHHINLHVRYYKNTKFLAKLIQHAASFKGNPKFAHTATIYKYGPDPRAVEARFDGVDHFSIYDAYFSNNFSGRVEALVLPAYKTKKGRQDLSDYVEHELLGKKYSKKKALLSYLDFFKDQKDGEDSVYCTDNDGDIYERTTHERFHFIDNNAEVTPGEYYKKCLEHTIDKFLIIDTIKGS
jgi:hypothetical protein